MTVVFEGFSIREYTSKIRSVNVAKCWPFDDENKASTTEKRTDEEINKLLPPLTCRKFRWWSDEVKLLNEEEPVKPLSDDDDDGELGSRHGGNKNGGFGFEDDDDDDDEKEKEEVVLTRKKKEKEDEKMVMVCPVCQKFTASTVNVVNIHIDSCLSKASKREKKLIRIAKKMATDAEAAKTSSKTKKKKRSIVEIFAVAPQIETLQIEEEEEDNYNEYEQEEDDDDDEEVEVRECTNNEKLLKGKKKKKKLLSSSSKVDITMGMIRNFKYETKKKKKKKRFDCSTVASTSLSPKLFKKKKKNEIKNKSKAPLLHQLLEKEISDEDNVIKKKVPSKRKNLLMQNECTNTILNSKLLCKHRQGKLPLLPVHSILRNQRSVVSCQKFSSIGNLQNCECPNFRCVRRSNKHVWFSGKDDILGPTRNEVSSFELPQIHNIHREVPSDVMGNTLVRQNVISAADEAPAVNGADAGVIFITNERNGLDDPTGFDSPPTFLSLNNISCRNKRKGLLVDSLDGTQEYFPHLDDSRLFNHGGSPAFYNLLSADMPRFVTSALKDGSASNLDSQRDGDVQGLVDMSGHLPNHFGNSVPQSVSNSSQLNMKTTAQLSSTCLTVTTESSGRKPYLPQNSRLTSNGNMQDNSTLHHLSPKDLMSCLSSSIEWKKQRGSICRGEHIDEDFIGLPLNSQGAYVQSTSSSSKVGYNCFQAHNLMWPTKEQYVGRPASRGHLKLFPEESCFRDNPQVTVPSSFGITQCTGGTEAHLQDSLRSESVRQLDSELSLLTLYSSGSCDQSGSTLSQLENQMTLPKKSPERALLPQNQTTVRLMGKDVTIGRTNEHAYSVEDEGLWTDKEIITEHRLPMAANDSSLLGYSCPEWIGHSVSHKAKETASHSWKAQTISPQILQMKAVEPRFSQSYYDRRTPFLSHAGVSMISKNQCLETRKADSVPSDPLVDMVAKAPASSISQNVSRYTGREMPVQSTTPHNAIDHTLFSSTQFKHGQSMAVHEKKSRFVFPFSSEDITEYVQPSGFKSSSQQLPQWLINAKQQKVTPPALSKPYTDVSATHHPSSNLGMSSPYKKSTAPLAPEPGTSIRSVQKSAGGTSLNFPPISLAPPGFRRCFPSKSFPRNIFKVKGGSKSRILSLNNIDQAKKTNKRPAATENDLSISFKRLNWQMQEFDAKLGLDRSADSSFHTQFNSSPPERDAYKSKGSDVGGDGGGQSQVAIHEEDGLGTLPSSNFCKLDTVARSGPIKLTAGAKHILKPSPKIARDMLKPTRPTISLGQVANASKVSELQNNPVHIFKF